MNALQILETGKRRGMFWFNRYTAYNARSAGNSSTQACLHLLDAGFRTRDLRPTKAQWAKAIGLAKLNML